MGHRGIVLVVVLWALTVIGVIAANFTTANRDGLFLARNTVERAKAEALADAGFYRAVMAILNEEDAPTAEGGAPSSGPAADRTVSLQTRLTGVAGDADTVPDANETSGLSQTAWRADGTVYQWRLGEGTVLLSVQDESGKFDLNGAGEDLLRQLFRGVGLSESEAQTLVDRIIDYRDADQERRPSGAEDFAYRRAGLAYGAKNGPFERTDELRRVLGVTPPLFARVKPLITVHSGQRGIDPDVAPIDVLRVLAGPDLSEAAAGTDPSLSERALRQPARSRSVSSRRRAFTIKAEAQTPGGGVFVRAAVVRLTGDREQPFAVVRWEQAGVRLGAAAAADTASD